MLQRYHVEASNTHAPQGPGSPGLRGCPLLFLAAGLGDKTTSGLSWELNETPQESDP